LIAGKRMAGTGPGPIGLTGVAVAKALGKHLPTAIKYQRERIEDAIKFVAKMKAE